MSNHIVPRQCLLIFLVLFAPTLVTTANSGFADEANHVITGVERQPFVAATRRLVEAMDFAGAPFSEEIRQKITDAAALPEDKDAIKQLQLILDPLCLAFVNINAESRVKVAEGPVAKELMQQGWRAFLIKVHNEAGINPVLAAESPNALPVYERGKGAREEPRTKEKLVNPEDVSDRFLDLSMLQREPLKDKLSGLLVEYRVLLLYSRDAGQREASLSFHIGAGTQDIGFRNAVPILFACKPAVTVKRERVQLAAKRWIFAVIANSWPPGLLDGPCAQRGQHSLDDGGA